MGWLVGAAGALAYWLASRTVPAPGVAVAASMAATLLLTGAFHEDGLADCADGFGGGYTPEDRLRIMRDSRIGAFGAIAVCMALLLKWQLLIPWRRSTPRLRWRPWWPRMPPAGAWR